MPNFNINKYGDGMGHRASHQTRKSNKLFSGASNGGNYGDSIQNRQESSHQKLGENSSTYDAMKMNSSCETPLGTFLENQRSASNVKPAVTISTSPPQQQSPLAVETSISARGAIGSSIIGLPNITNNNNNGASNL